MSRYRNAGTEPVWFRDDDGKHEVHPGDSFDVVGDQHIEHVLTLPGVTDATVPELVETAEDAGVKVPARARKADVVAIVDSLPTDTGTTTVE